MVTDRKTQADVWAAAAWLLVLVLLVVATLAMICKILGIWP